MRYLLDTNAFSMLIKGRSQPLIDRYMQARADGHELLLSATVLAELLYGIELNRSAKLLSAIEQIVQQHRLVPFDIGAARAYAKLRVELEANGKPIGPNDYFIAAVAVANGLILVTHNTREFGRVPGLVYEDWEI